MQRTVGTPRAFRAHFAEHNRQVILLTVTTFISAVLLWLVAYIILYWLTLILVTSGEGVDAHVPASFTKIFAMAAGGLCVLGWLVQKIAPNYFPRDRKPAFEVFMDFVLAAPRVTLAIWGNLSAWQSLTEYELEEAWELFHTIAQQGKLSIYSLPLEIPNAELRSKVLFALQVAGLIEMRKNEEGAWLALQGDKARKLGRATIKIDAGRRI